GPAVVSEQPELVTLTLVQLQGVILVVVRLDVGDLENDLADDLVVLGERRSAVLVELPGFDSPSHDSNLSRCWLLILSIGASLDPTGGNLAAQRRKGERRSAKFSHALAPCDRLLVLDLLEDEQFAQIDPRSPQQALGLLLRRDARPRQHHVELAHLRG